MRGGAILTGLCLSVLGAACTAAVTPGIEPPSIELAGVPTEVRHGPTVEYEFADGRTRRVDPDLWRPITPHGTDGALVIFGTDANGPFVAGFVPQGGLPADCYVENDVGTDWGRHIEIHGILWEKAAAFLPAASVGMGDAYPSGTRFCFTAEGLIGSTVAP